MEKFFTPEKLWKDARPFPHVLVLLGEYPEFREYARVHHGLFAEYGDKLGIIPEEWLHATIQGIFHPLETVQVDQLRVTLRDELAGMRTFRVQLGPVGLGVTAVTVAVYPEDGMAELNRHVRAAIGNVPGISLPAREARFWAHTSLAYAKADFPDRDFNRALRALRPPRVHVTIDRVHLVNQYQHPDCGYYTWDIVEEIPLG